MTTTIDRPQTSILETGEYRVEGREKVSGEALYAADYTMPGMLWSAFVTSPTPHAKIASIDASAARAMKGVHVVLTGQDIGEHYFGRKLLDWPVLAIDRVRFIGDYVAAIAAETPEIAQAAAAAIEVEYEELPAIFDPQEAMASDALVLHEHAERYPFLAPPPKRLPVPHPNIQGYEKVVNGDVDAVFAKADRVFEETYRTPRHFPGYIEPRATLVWIDDDGLVHVISTNKSPYGLRDQMALCIGIPKEKIVIEPCFIGGEFGAKGLSVEEFHCYFLAAATKRPVKHVRNYLDDIQGTNVRHASTNRFRTAVSKDGKILALDVRVVFDGGAYAAGKIIPHLLPGMYPKTPYHIPAARIERMTVYTNTVPGGFLRAPGDVQTLFGLEAHIDTIARELRIDPLEFRLRNAMRPGEPDMDGRPHHDANGVAVLETLREHVDWGRKREPGRGHGIALTARHIGGGNSMTKLSILPGGIVDIRTGCTEVGVGALTMTARVAAQVLEVDPARVRVRRDSTANFPFDFGVGGSRTTHILGEASFDAATQLRAQLDALGYPQKSWDDATAELLRAGPVDITGNYVDTHKHGVDPDWTDVSLFYVDLSVDKETGTIEIHDVLCIIDAGTIINPVAFRGQLNGGFVFGVGHALTEDLRVEGGKIVNLNLGDYKLPTQMDVPPFRSVHVKAADGPGPFGAKMIGELTTSGVAPAIANAIADACGVRISELPITAERIFEALH
ncbi:MAG TPA: xanthine dehydrogenase family protein molybdopterin-binding subunit [Candidatus Binatia bacterium]|nr:xanthine dehydrogenase family protein molybdopterin-binding subunit [Candidatus Binatia bacterium]